MHKERNAQEPLNRVRQLLQAVSQFSENDIMDAVVLNTAFQLTVASGDPRYADDRIHIDNGLERLGGIAIQKSDAFRDNFVLALAEGEKTAAEKGFCVSDHVKEVADIISITAAKQRLVA